MVPDQSTKPVFDGKSVMMDEGNSHRHAETAVLLEKGKWEEGLQERQEEEQTEELKSEKLEQEQKAKRGTGRKGMQNASKI